MDSLLTADIYQLINPNSEDFVFYWDSKQFTIPAHGHKLYPEPLARHGAKKLAQHLLRTRLNDNAILRTDLLDAEINKICKLYQASEYNEADALSERISELNPEEETMSEKEIAEEKAIEEAHQKEVDTLSQMNAEEADKQDRLEALKVNNPKAYRAEMLSEMTKAELLVEAEKLGIESVSVRSNKPEIVTAIIEAE